MLVSTRPRGRSLQKREVMRSMRRISISPTGCSSALRRSPSSLKASSSSPGNSSYLERRALRRTAVFPSGVLGPVFFRALWWLNSAFLELVIADSIRLWLSQLTATGLRSALDTCATLTEATASGEGPLLLIGLFADDPFPTIARLSVEFAEREGHPPDRAELIEAYYGLPVPDLSLYVGFEKPEMFDVPLLTNGLENLYATLNPSPDLTQRQLREILYDHLVTRRAAPVDYDALSPEAQLELAEYNERCKGDTLGIGRIDLLTGLWRPLLPTGERYSGFQKD